MLMEKMSLYNQFKSVPTEAQKQIQAGRLKGMTDINPMWRIKVLTEMFGPCGIGWYYEPKRKWLESSDTEVAAFVDIELFIKVDNEWSKPICGTGGSKFVAKESKGPYTDDECYKKATTDAIGVACKQLGIGADVYWDKDRTKYTPLPEQTPREEITNYKEQLVLYCKERKLNFERLLFSNNVTETQLTESQARELLAGLRNKYGD